MFYLMFGCVWFFKFWSFHHIWHDVRYHVIKANRVLKVGENLYNKVKIVKTSSKNYISKEKLKVEIDIPRNLIDEI